MKLTVDIDTGIASYLERIKRERDLPNTEEAIRFLCNYHDMKEYAAAKNKANRFHGG